MKHARTIIDVRSDLRLTIEQELALRTSSRQLEFAAYALANDESSARRMRARRVAKAHRDLIAQFGTRSRVRV